ncbi:hypothetical protein [Chitinophaga qingshengii]|uniref:Carboxypeptidase regulatory-like domain-containing protein n=1 Tax=Chitinophaga qingshengii TaxID=1569794 RepID=A0ABR7TSE6_9BACT|nr:hypothetical protein [Chitinophaga qingshengii]MBC9933398.1 hypothetical protein [Chitinophaga qingshengii]
MSYLLIGNISALICDDCIEPLVNARIRVYLPDNRYPVVSHKGIFSDLQPLSAKDVLMKADRLLAETTLDEQGNFTLSWQQIHLFTEPLELDLCLDSLPGRTGIRQPRNFHLCKAVLHWKRSVNGYIGAYAYVVPSNHWNAICGDAGAWVITGTVKQRRDNGYPQPTLRVEAYNAITGKLVGSAFTNEYGRYTLRFSRKDLYHGSLQPVRQGRIHMGPDVYFRIYQNDRLVLEENETHANAPERQDLAPCSCHHLLYRPSVMKWASGHIQGWINDVKALSGKSKKKKELYLSSALF